jgi:hypothetical protein
MEFSSQFVPAVIILAANLLSGKHSSLRWEQVTAIFGWTAAVTLPLWILAALFFSDASFTSYLGQVACFSLVTALARDYERILHPLFSWNK